jgi:hypothetical protein
LIQYNKSIYICTQKLLLDYGLSAEGCRLATMLVLVVDYWGWCWCWCWCWCYSAGAGAADTDYANGAVDATDGLTLVLLKVCAWCAFEGIKLNQMLGDTDSLQQTAEAGFD